MVKLLTALLALAASVSALPEAIAPRAAAPPGFEVYVNILCYLLIFIDVIFTVQACKAWVSLRRLSDLLNFYLSVESTGVAAPLALLPISSVVCLMFV